MKENLRARILRLARENPGQLRDALLPLLNDARATPTFKRAQVRVASTEVTAAVSGVWAVHKGIDTNGWTLSHIPTGLAARKGLETKTAAMAIVMAMGRVEPALLTAQTEADVMGFRATLIDIMADPHKYLQGS